MGKHERSLLWVINGLNSLASVSPQDLSLTAKVTSLAQLDELKSKYNEALAAKKQTELEIEVLRPVRQKRPP